VGIEISSATERNSAPTPRASLPIARPHVRRERPPPASGHCRAGARREPRHTIPPLFWREKPARRQGSRSNGRGETGCGTANRAEARSVLGLTGLPCFEKQEAGGRRRAGRARDGAGVAGGPAIHRAPTPSGQPRNQLLELPDRRFDQGHHALALVSVPDQAPERQRVGKTTTLNVAQPPDGAPRRPSGTDSGHEHGLSFANRCAAPLPAGEKGLRHRPTLLGEGGRAAMAPPHVLEAAGWRRLRNGLKTPIPIYNKVFRMFRITARGKAGRMGLAMAAGSRTDGPRSGFTSPCASGSNPTREEAATGGCDRWWLARAEYRGRPSQVFSRAGWKHALEIVPSQNWRLRS